jgi:hypothetical protein
MKRKDAPAVPVPVVVDTIANRGGNRLRNCLIQQLRDVPIPAKERYVLRVYLAQIEGNIGRIGRTYSAVFSLVKAKDKQSVCGGGATASSTYGATDTSSQVTFAVFNSMDDAMIDQVGSDIVEQIRMHFQKVAAL